MTDLNDANIKELLAKSDEELRAALEAMLPKPTFPEHMFDLRAKHPELGEVVCIWDKPSSSGDVFVRWRDESDAVGSRGAIVPVAELTFPEQATKPEDVPVGEAWLVNVDNWSHSGKRVVALKHASDDWRTGDGVVDDEYWWRDEEVTLISPLVPVAPAPEPEPEPEHPRTLSSVEDYESAPVGTVVASPDNNPWVKVSEEGWLVSGSLMSSTNSDMAELDEKDVLRKGWGNE